MKVFLTAFIIGIAAVAAAASSESFEEEVYVQPLPSPGARLTAFQLRFESAKEEAEAAASEGLFPKAISELAERFGVAELRVTLAKGRWLGDAWGAAPADAEAPQGTELWARFAAENSSASVDARWDGLRHALSGLLCTSLSSMGAELTARPLFFDGGRSSSSSNSSQLWRHGAMPGETVCTENLTPWVRLLPCRDRAGVGALLNPLRLYGVPYHAMGLHFLADDGGVQRLLQTLTVVLERPNAQKGVSVEAAFEPLRQQQSTRPSLAAGLTACPLARRSVLRVAAAAGTDAVTPTDSQRRRVVVVPGVVEYALHPTEPLRVNVGLEAFPHSDAESALGPLAVSAHRVLTGYGQQGGGLLTTLQNTRAVPVTVTLFQSFPIFIRPLFSLLGVRVNGTASTAESALQWIRVDAGGSAFDERPSPATLELSAELAPRTELAIDVAFETSFLHISKHPPDANHGRDLAAGVIVVTERGLPPKVQYTEGVLIALPTPDFSMPYNVITLTCTAVALFYGSLLSRTTMHWSRVFAANAGDLTVERPIVRILRAALRLLKRPFSKATLKAT